MFITGTGRNGSTLLSCILNNHSGVLILPENTLIPFLIKNFVLQPNHSWERRITSILFEIKRNDKLQVDIEVFEKNLKNLNPVQQNTNGVMGLIYEIYAERYGKKRFFRGDKTPENNKFIQMIKHRLPNSKLVFLIRDPRDMIYSMLKLIPGYDTNFVNYCIMNWRSSLDKYEWLKNKYPDAVFLVKYEQLVQQPDFVICELINWLNLPLEASILESYNKNLNILNVQHATHHLNINNAINTNSIGQGLELEKGVLNRIESQLLTKMRKYGYC
ncbi:MAG: sulfotransferase [Saprospiraceae bacterium]